MWISKILFTNNGNKKLFENLKQNEINIFIGDPSTGKTKLTRGIAHTWQNCINNVHTEDYIKIEIRHLNFTLGIPDPANAKKIKDIFIKENNDVSCGILYYPVERIALSYDKNMEKMPTSAKCFYRIKSDFDAHSIKNSIIIIDDFDLKNNKNQLEDFISGYATKILKNDNQLIITCCNENILDCITIPYRKYTI
jgi:hypothetical protein